MALGVTDSVGSAFTVRFTGTVNGLLPAPAAVIVILVLYFPAVRPVVTMDAAMGWGVVPLPGVTLNQLAPDAAVKLKPATVLPTFTFCAAGAAPPDVYVKLRGEGVAVSELADRFNVTGMTAGLPATPDVVDVTVMEPV